MENYIHIGKIVAAHGVGGELIIQHILGRKQAFKKVKAVYVEEVKGAYIPYFLKNSNAKNEEETVLSLEDVDSREKALRFVKKNLWLSEADFGQAAEKTAPVSLLGYDIYDDKELIGKVIEVIEQPHQVLLKTSYAQKEVLVPLHEETLIHIDRKLKEIWTRLPDGLLQIYLEN